MRSEMQAIFGAYRWPVVCFNGAQAVWHNAAGERFLNDNGIECVLSELPENALISGGGALSGTFPQKLGGGTWSIADLDGERLLTVMEETGADGKDVVISAGGAIRDAMSTLRMSSDLLMPYIETLGDKKAEKYAAVLTHSYYSILRVTNNMEELAGTWGSAAFTDIDINELCARLAEKATSALRDEGKSVVFSGVEEPVIIRGDRDRLELMLYNLISNALHRTGLGGEVVLSLTKMSGAAAVSVRDFGIGISGEKASAALSGESARDYADGENGAGLGLASVSAAARAHGGSIIVAPTDRGTTVTVRIPLSVGGEDTFCNAGGEYVASPSKNVLTGLADVLGWEAYTYRYLD